MFALTKKHSSIEGWSLRKRLLFTVAVLVLYRLGNSIPLPYVDNGALKAMWEAAGMNSILQAMSMFGSSFNQLSLLSLGVMPYITASIVFQLMKLISPKIEEMYRTDGEQKSITQWTRYLTVALATLQAVSLTIGAPALFNGRVFSDDSLLAKITTVFALVVGALIVMRMGEEITQRGIGNGASLVIFTSIAAGLPSLFSQSLIAKNDNWAYPIAILAFFVAVLALVVFVEKSEYRAPVTYMKSSVSTRTASSFIPVKVAIAGVLPVIFSGSFMMMPQFIYNLFPRNQWVGAVYNFIQANLWAYYTLDVLLTIGFVFFSIPLVFDVKRLTSDINSRGGFIPGRRPGEETFNFLNLISHRMAVLCALYLTLLVLSTALVLPQLGLQNGGFSATSLIILSTVAITFVTTVEAEKTKSSPKSILR